ncbi:MAG: acyl-CoA dehydrogenase family protein [Aureliella sp.]
MRIQSTDSLQPLCDQLLQGAKDLSSDPIWPTQQIDACRDAEVFRWFIPEQYGGLGWSERQLLDGYLALSQSCLTTTFILTQWVAACRRILGSTNAKLRDELLPAMASGKTFATVGISHLTTSRQHVAPVLRAQQTVEGDYRLDGFSPWVTGAPAADVIVLGATMEDGKQIIAAVPSSANGVKASPGGKLVALSCSCTDRVDLENVTVKQSQIVAGPIENVMQTNSGGGAGGLQTSTLAIGLAQAAANYLAQQSEQRPDLKSVADKMSSDVEALKQVLVELTTQTDASVAPATSAIELRTQANSLVLRSTQAALSAAKGAGFMADHCAGRWAQQALFFLVWSCPQGVVSANLCELAHLD